VSNHGKAADVGIRRLRGRPKMLPSIAKTFKKGFTLGLSGAPMLIAA